MGEDIKNIGRGRLVLCPKCHKAHVTEKAPVDEYIDCECGFSFYAFVDHDLRIIMTPGEASYEPIARAIRRFVVSTGRCKDIPYELYCDAAVGEHYQMQVQERDLDNELMRVLEDYQVAAFGECFLTKEVIDSVCETFRKGNDVELKNQKDRVEVREMKVRNVSKQKERQTGRLIAYGAELAKRRPASGGILMVSQYQAQ